MTNIELRKLRLKLDVTQAEMAEKLGVSKATYCLYELGKKPLRKSMILLAQTMVNSNPSIDP